MASLLKRIRDWNEERRLIRNRRLFMKLWENSDSGIKAVVQAAANNIAMTLVMAWLDNKRILHCQWCPETDSLRNHPQGKFCTTHYAVVTQQKTDPTNGGNNHEREDIKRPAVGN